MSARRGWCPGVFDPMPTGDGLLVRVKPPLGMVSAGAASALADAARAYGNGTIELTRRGNLQVRGLSAAGVAPLAAAMIGCGLAHADADAERRRALMVSPLIGDDPSLAPDTAAIAGAIERGLIGEPRCAALPPKFGIVVDGGGVLPLYGIAADIAVRARDDGFVVVAAGCELAFAREPAQVASLVLGLVTQIVMPGLDPGIQGLPAAREDVDGRNKSDHDDKPRVGFIGYDGLQSGAFGLGIPFGTMRPETFRALSGLAARYGDGKLRMTPWRAIVIGGVAERAASPIAHSAAPLGLIVEPADKRLRVVACPGSPGCASATVAARADAARIADALPAGTGAIHVSGCRKGCAHPRPAAITLVGDRGGYGIVRRGTAADAPETSGLTIVQALDRLQAELAA